MTDRRALVLVAEDDEDIRRLVVLRLERAGFEVVATADGESALDLLAAKRPDLAVLDVTMPGVTGLDVTRRIRASEDGTRRLPILLLTARVQDEDLKRGLAAGADAYVRKPFGAELVQEIETLLRAAGAAA